MACFETIGNLLFNHRKTTEPDAGFTLLEALVVIAILGLVVAFLAPPMIREFDGHKIATARQEMKQLTSALDSYHRDVGRYPTTAQGMASLVSKPPDVGIWKGPYLMREQSLEDPWNQPWVYRVPSTRARHEYDLCSAGLDKVLSDPTNGDASCNP